MSTAIGATLHSFGPLGTRLLRACRQLMRTPGQDATSVQPVTIAHDEATPPSPVRSAWEEEQLERDDARAQRRSAERLAARAPHAASLAVLE